MKRYEYEISSHHLGRENKMRIFCSEKGECSVEEVGPPDSQLVVDSLNERGGEWMGVSRNPLRTGWVRLLLEEGVDSGGEGDFIIATFVSNDSWGDSPCRKQLA